MQLSLKKISLRLLFCLEIIVFAWFYFVGSQGMSTIWLVQKENNDLESSLNMLTQEIHILEKQIADWNQYPFFAEKIAREQLQMARPDDIIYFLSKE